MRTLTWTMVGAAIGASVLLGACRDRGPEIVPEVIAVQRPAVEPDPAHAAWRDAPVHVAALMTQDMVEPRLLEPSTTQVRVQAITDGRAIAFRLEWADPSADDVAAPGRFSDAVAVQLPDRLERDAPAPQMGEPARPVEISYWRASWQASVEGRGNTMTDLYPRASADHYPFEAASLPRDSPEQRAMAERYAPARALGNHMGGPRTSPVQDLVATGPSTLVPASRAISSGSGLRTADGWSVVLKRPLPEGFAPGVRYPVAFAVWQGAAAETGARKMRTGWVLMSMEGVR